MIEQKLALELKKLVPEESERKIFAKVFDSATVKAVHRLSTKGYFQMLEHVISTGKEAHVFRAVDMAGNSRAVKIYKIGTSSFNKMQDYLRGDRRFDKVKKTKRAIVFAWAKKEFSNLLLLNEAGVRCPMPLAFFENVLVMEFIGEEEEAAPRLKESPPENAEKAYKTLVEFLARMLFKAELIHADFSEYNILNKGGELVVIDVGQAVVNTHPMAEEFFERDLRNTARYFRKLGFDKKPEQVKEDVRALKGKI